MRSAFLSFLLFLLSVLSAAATFPTVATTSSSQVNVSTIYQHSGNFWYENIAVRSTNRKLLVTSLTAGQIFEFSPTGSPTDQPLAIASLPSSSGLNTSTGIVEVEPDVFAFSASNTNFLFGSWEIWKLDLRPQALSANGTGQLTRVAAVKKAGLLNGLALLRSPDLVVATDTFQPVIWRIDLSTGDYNVVINDTILSAPAAQLGANGIKIFPQPALHSSTGDGDCESSSNDQGATLNRTLCFTNTYHQLFGSFPIDPVSGAATGPAKRIAIASPPNNGKSNYDDFWLDSRGNAYLANGYGDTVNFVAAGSGQQSVLAGALNSTLIAEPTSVALDAMEKIAFVTTAGGLKSPEGKKVVGGQVLRIEL
ncbi:MAG: hypothetical protein LQ340_005045 [Diploschistes diacapsis]|nr:MAG: hypothetical protein LQ340_005045 [Diploschistes diacapsis]